MATAGRGYTFRFHGASTGRWTSHGIQLQNMKRPVVGDMAAAIAAVASGDLNQLRRQIPAANVGDRRHHPRADLRRRLDIA